MSKIFVIGGGAAGMMAAYAAAQPGNQVIIFEKNEKVGKKLYITGKGRCNVTNDCEPEVFFQNVVHNAKFLYSAFYTFSNVGIMSFLEDAGCPLKTERGNRVFPVSDHASDVIRALSRKLKEKQVEVRLKESVSRILVENAKVSGVILENGKRERADAVIIATGGLSYPSTGSTGDGYRMAARCGHKIVETGASLVPLVIKEAWCNKLQGLSLKNVEISLIFGQNSKELYRGFGEMLFTHFGVSGPVILSASSFYPEKMNNNECYLKIDLKPALTEEALDKRILRDFEENRKKQFKNAIGKLFPSKLIPVMIELSGIHPDKPVNEITKEERKNFVHKIKNWYLTVTGSRDFSEAVITRGGVDIKEVNPSTMESKRVKGLYFAGEVLDLDALTGGFNLQIAWSTGYLAGMSAGEAGKEKRRKESNL